MPNIKTRRKMTLMSRRIMRKKIETIHAIANNPTETAFTAVEKIRKLLNPSLGSTSNATILNVVAKGMSQNGLGSIDISDGHVSVTVPPSIYASIRHCLEHGKKIMAIRELRAATGVGLKDSKDLVEGDPKLVNFFRPPPPYTNPW